LILRRSKPPLFLHIGLGKTGTTVLQEFFWSNRGPLKKHGVNYPDYGVVAGAHHLLSSHIPPDLKDAWNFVPVQDWVRKLARGRAPRVLLSSELISSTADDSVVRAFCSTINSKFSLKVVVYLRRQDNLIMASYNQHVKTGKQRLKLVDVYQNMAARFDFEALLKPWAESVGTENVIVRAYEREQFYARDIRRDFLYHVLGIDDPAGFELATDNPNPRLDATTLEYKRLLNNVVQDPVKAGRFKELLLEYSSAQPPMGEPQDLLPPAIRREIVDNYDQRNRDIARTFLGRADGGLFLEPLPGLDEPWAEKPLSAAQAAAISSHLTGRDPQLMQWLAAELPKYVDHDMFWRKRAARLLTATL
jgi:hypothetical protein